MVPVSSGAYSSCSLLLLSLLFSPCLLTSVRVLKSNGVFFGFLSYPVLVGMFSVVAWLLQDVCVPLFICPFVGDDCFSVSFGLPLLPT